MAYKIPRLPRYAGKIFRGRSIPDNHRPDDCDVELVLATLRGKRIAQIIADRAAFGRDQLGMADVMAACKRVRDAVRRGEAPDRIKAHFPDFVEWQTQKFPYIAPKPKPETGHPPRLPCPPMSDEETKIEAEKRAVVRAAAASNVQDHLRRLKLVALAEPESEITPETAVDYAKRMHAKTLPFLTGIAVVKLAERMVRGDSELIKRGLDAAGFPGGRGKGLNIGISIGAGAAAHMRSGVTFEKLLRQVRDEEGAPADAEARALPPGDQDGEEGNDREEAEGGVL